jgi:hypothetical protein
LEQLEEFHEHQLKLQERIRLAKFGSVFGAPELVKALPFFGRPKLFLLQSNDDGVELLHQHPLAFAELFNMHQLAQRFSFVKALS